MSKTWEKSTQSKSNTAEESPSKFIQRVNGIQGVVIMWSCVCLSVCVWKSVNALTQLLQPSSEQKEVENTPDYVKLQSLQLLVKNCEMSADKFDMLFIFMFTVAGIFQLIIVRWNVFLCKPTDTLMQCLISDGFTNDWFLYFLACRERMGEYKGSGGNSPSHKHTKFKSESHW